MKYATICSGIEGATAAWYGLGWTPLWFSEVDPFCNALLEHWYPEIPNHGDVTRICWSEVERPDLFAGGTPCQGLSLAGKRGGFDDPRSALAWSFVDGVAALRPRWFLWENVPGVLSSGGGRDLGAFVGALADLGYGIAWRVLDAQFFGLAQRRERLFLVGCPGAGRAAFEVLHEPESLRGDPAKGRRAKKDAARRSARRAGRRGGEQRGDVEEVARPLPVKGNSLHDESQETYVVGDQDGSRTDIVPSVAWQCHGNNVGPMGILRAGNGGLTGGVPFVLADADRVSHPLRADGFDASEDGTGRGTPLVAAFGGGNTKGRLDVATCQTAHGSRMDFDTETFVIAAREPSAVLSFDNRQDPIVQSDGSSRPIGAKDNGQGVCHAFDWTTGQNVRADVRANTMNLRPYAPSLSAVKQPATWIPPRVVRRLTPTECERLQGFPDDYTLIPFGGGIGRQRDADELIAYVCRRHPDWTEEYARTLASDGARYKALGNSWPIFVVTWIGRRIAAMDAKMRAEER